MPDLNLIKQLNIKYGNASLRGLQYNLESLTEAFDLTKGFGTEALSGLGAGYDEYFASGPKEEAFLLFIDVCNFSTRFADYSGSMISDYFNEYYSKVIPLIYKYGGEVEKIIGDGIIALFGKPFLQKDSFQCFEAADKCAKEILLTTGVGKFSSKVAFHQGVVNFFKNKSGYYHEYTMVGKPLTELFRLESIAENNCLNYFVDSNIHKYYLSRQPRYTSNDYSVGAWVMKDKDIYDLKGVAYKKMCYMKFQKRN